MTETFIGLADRFVYPRHQPGDFVRPAYGRLNDREFVATQPCDKSIAFHATAQRGGDGFQQFVADHMAERIVDALEFIDVQIEHGQLLVRRDPCKLLFEMLAKQHAVWQIGQGVVMRHMGDPLV
jgi:hypothetical protein